LELTTSRHRKKAARIKKCLAIYREIVE